MINHLKPNEVFVFGSNLAGNHAGGAAYQAQRDFGAETGVGEGLTGQCYAFPTLNTDFSKVTNTQLKESRRKLYKTAEDHPNKTFLLTKVGCGIAGFSEEKIKKLFINAPKNIIKPEEWT